MTALTVKSPVLPVLLICICFWYTPNFAQKMNPGPAGNDIRRSSFMPEGGCGFTPMHEKQLQQETYRSRQEAVEEMLYRKALEIGRGRKTNTGEEKALAILTIPLVIHIIHLSSEPNPGDGPSNPTDAQILAGVEHLNQAYRNTGVYAANGHQSHPALQSVDVEIEFCLARQDINGNPTSGILRYTSDAYANLNSDQEDPQMQQWVAAQNGGVYPGSDYAQVWLVNEICQDSGSPSIPDPCGIAGYAYFPGGHGNVNNGVINVAKYWGASTNSSKVHIHEFGHYLNLYHSFQGGCPNGNCLTSGDRVCDTPPDNSTTYSSCGAAANSCDTDADDTSANNPLKNNVDDLYENYMDYSANNCQNTFTQGQKDRMRAALQGARGSLLNSAACLPGGGCLEVELVLNSSPISSGVYDEAGTISSSGSLATGANVSFMAAESIRLLPGFQAKNGTSFRAAIEACDPAALAETPVDLSGEAAAATPASPTQRTSDIELEIAPNPFRDQTTIRYFLPEGLPAPTLFLLSGSGQLLRTFRLEQEARGHQQLTLSTEGLPAGMYFLLLRAGERVVSRRIVVLG